MEQKILLATQDLDWAREISALLETKNISCETVSQGRDCQLLLYRKKFSMIFLDPDIKNHSGVEVLKYIKLNHPSLKVVLTFASETRSKEYEPLTRNATKVGISKFFVGRVSPKATLEFVLDNTAGVAWKKNEPSAQSDIPEERVRDKDCTRVTIEDFLTGNQAIFDYYLRLKENHFVKILKRGETIELERVLKLQGSGVKHFYFLTQERRNYINYMNELMKLSLASSQTESKVSLHQVTNVSDKLMEEIHVRGLKPELVEEAKSFSNNIFSLVTKDERLSAMNSTFKEFDLSKLTHSFLTCFFSAVICKNLDWVGPKTIETICMGAMLHDIGILKLPQEFRDKHPDKMSEKEFEQYQEHPRLGANLLLNIPHLNPQIIQIVYQHHENINGSGFPNQLTGARIYPLAKIVSLADELADNVTEDLISPLEAVRALLRDRERHVNFDPLIIKSLVSGFVTGGKK